MFCGLIRNTCLRLSCRNAHSNGCELLIWLGDKIQNRRSDYGSLNTHQSQWRLQPEYLSFTDQTVHQWRLTEILYLSKCIFPCFYIYLFGFSSFYLHYEVSFTNTQSLNWSNSGNSQTLAYQRISQCFKISHSHLSTHKLDCCPSNNINSAAFIFHCYSRNLDNIFHPSLVEKGAAS